MTARFSLMVLVGVCSAIPGLVFGCDRDAAEASNIHPPHRLRLIGSPVIDSGATAAGPVDEDFAGPFASWDNIKTRYGAKGDGSSDDTKAFQAAFDQVGLSGKSPVVYLPAGTYVIKSTLLLANRFGISFIGEDPATTIIRWGGASGGLMASFDGVHTSTLERMTWDGGGVAAIGIKFFKSGTYPISGSKIEHRDMIYKDMTSMGVQGGEMPPGVNDEMHQFIRNKFIRCGEGIGLRSWNALLYLIMDSEFIDNGTAIRSAPGSFNAYRNVFRNSTVVDMEVHGNTNGIRNNISIGSKSFLMGVGKIAVQGNTVIDPKASPVIDLYGQDLIMVDNVVTAATDGTGPILQHRFAYGYEGTDVIVGNTFTSDNTYSLASGTHARIYDNRVVSRSEVPDPAVALPPTPAKTTRPIIEVAAGADGQAIQSAIDQAMAQYSGKRPIIHLPSSQYVVRSTLVIPPNSDIELLGDTLTGGNTQGTELSWGGATTTAPLLQINGPTHARLTRLSVSGGYSYRASGILVTNADQPGSQAILNRTDVDALEHTVWLHGLKNSKVDMYVSDLTSGNIYDLQQTTTASAVRVDGAGAGTTSRFVNYGAGVHRDNNSVFDMSVVEVFNQGRALMYDGWDECCSPRKLFLRGQNNGTLTYWGYLFANHENFDYPWVAVDGFHGMLSLLGVNMVEKPNPVVIRTEAADTDVLVLQAFSYVAHPVYDRLSTGGQVSFVQRAAADALVADAGDPLTKERLLAHLMLPRTVVPSRPQAVTVGVTDLRMDRVIITRARTGIELRPGPEPTPTPTPTPVPTPTIAPTPLPTPSPTRPGNRKGWFK